MFQDERGSISHKRVIGATCALFLCVTMMMTAFSPEHIKPSDTVVSAVESIAIACIAGTTLDKFSFKGLTKTEDQQPS